MKAIRIKGLGQAAIEDAPIPHLREDYILVKTRAVAINPADWKMIDYAASPGQNAGFDYSGVVVKAGSLVQDRFQPGDRVAGFVHGCNALNHEDGAFAEYLTAKGDVQIKIPDTVSFETAATLGAGVLTAGQSLYQSLGLPLPKSEATDKSVLIYGGSSATGSLAIQFAKLSGFQVITTCSPAHEDWLHELGADHIFDYKSPTCVSDIRTVTHNELSYSLDTIGTKDTAKICCDAMGAQEGIFASLAPISELSRDDVVNKSNVVFTALGEPMEFGGNEIPANEVDHAFAIKFIKIVEELLSQGEFRSHPVNLQQGGLEGVLDGVDKLRKGTVSGVKLVYAISES
ncbi:zinc-binding oxidoreductase [Fusarium heterosporum]|uniref:Zinc-binding oxidoreductase n=1 Tax=Fusarium heterosporum TaxID=42747 RepID=A0A8H5T0Q7_FUSHE|nr:zinc-binding oxidoreductase [Fusarium heterosporum]